MEVMEGTVEAARPSLRLRAQRSVVVAAALSQVSRVRVLDSETQATPYALAMCDHVRTNTKAQRGLMFGSKLNYQCSTPKCLKN